MRLRLFDRIRRLAHFRRSPVETASGQGRHRRQRRGDPAAAPASLDLPDGQGSPGRPGSPDGPDSPGDWSPPPGPSGGAPPAELSHTASPWPDASPVAEAPVTPAPRRDPAQAWADPRVGGSHRAAGASAARGGAGRARIREAPAPPEAAVGLGEAAQPALAQAPAASLADTRAAELARVASGVPRQPDGSGRPAARPGGAASRTGLPYTSAHPPGRPLGADGRRHTGSLEAILWRQWDPASPPSREVVAAVDRLAELPERIKERLADGLEAIFIGPGGVPELDEMTSLRGVPLPSGKASWDACAGAYGERKIVVGSRPSPTPDVMCHEVGHALDDLDGPPGKWQSDSAEFRMLYDQCRPHFASDFHRQPGGLGRKEFFADAFAAIASRQRPALVDMLSGDTRTALRVMLYFNRRYGI